MLGHVASSLGNALPGAGGGGSLGLGGIAQFTADPGSDFLLADGRKAYASAYPDLQSIMQTNLEGTTATWVKEDKSPGLILPAGGMQYPNVVTSVGAYPVLSTSNSASNEGANVPNMLITMDGGFNWIGRRVPLVPRASDGGTDYLYGMVGRRGTGPATLFAWTNYTMFRSKDYGVTWTRIYPAANPSYNYVGVDHNSSVVLVYSGGQYFMSVDDGDTWLAPITYFMPANGGWQWSCASIMSARGSIYMLMVQDIYSASQKNVAIAKLNNLTSLSFSYTGTLTTQDTSNGQAQSGRGWSTDSYEYFNIPTNYSAYVNIWRTPKGQNNWTSIGTYTSFSGGGQGFEKDEISCLATGGGILRSTDGLNFNPASTPAGIGFMGLTEGAGTWMAVSTAYQYPLYRSYTDAASIKFHLMPDLSGSMFSKAPSKYYMKVKP